MDYQYVKTAQQDAKHAKIMLIIAHCAMIVRITYSINLNATKTNVLLDLQN